jgi:hypothetical protein
MDDLDRLINEAAAVIVPALPRGRRPSAEAPTVVRAITREDLKLLDKPMYHSTQPLQKLRFTHHLAARCIAEGRTNVETAEITGYSTVRIGTLLQDPTFKELVAAYREEVQGKWLGVQERLAALGIAMTEEIQERLDQAPDKFSSEELRRWVETLLDRGGFGPTKTANVNVKSQSTVLSLIEQIKAEEQGSARVKLLAAE